MVMAMEGCMATRTLVDADIRKISVECGCVPRTIERFLRGLEVKGVSARRIMTAMDRLGFSEHLPFKGLAKA